MTFITPIRTPGDVRPAVARRKPPRVPPSLLLTDEDGARRALGSELALPDPAAIGAGLKHLARIALG